MFEIFIESVSDGWFAALFVPAGFFLALLPRLKHPGPLALVLIGVAFTSIVFGLLMRQLLINLIWDTCQSGGGRLAVELQIWATLIFGAMLTFGVGLFAGALWRKGRKLWALVFVVIVGLTAVAAAYLALVTSGMSAASCLT